MLVLELTGTLIISLWHQADIVDVLRQAVPLVREADVTESALVAQRLEVLLGRATHAGDRRHALSRRFHVVFVIGTRSARHPEHAAIKLASTTGKLS